MSSAPLFDYLFKVVLVGDSGTGKSCITNRFVSNSFLQAHDTTIGVDFYVKILDLNGKKVKLQIWDTAGQERFRTIVPNYYRSSQGVILVYDCTDRRTFDHLLDWLREVDRYANEDADRVIVGNKSDAPPASRAVDTATGKFFAENLGVSFYETSAKSGSNIEGLFMNLAESIKRRVDASSPETKKEVELHNTEQERQKGCC